MASSKFVVDVGARASRAKLRHDDFNGPFSRTDQNSAEADFLQKCSKEILRARIVVFIKATSATIGPHDEVIIPRDTLKTDSCCNRSSGRLSWVQDNFAVAHLVVNDVS